MKRKVIKLADTTYVVSMPLKWARANNVKKGDEVEVHTKDSEMTINLREKDYTLKKIEQDISDLSQRSTLWTISALYKQGFDEIRVKIKDEVHRKFIEKMVKEVFMGFMIVDQKKESCTLKQISVEREDEFNSVIRRAFLVTLSLCDESLDLLEKKDYESLIHLLSLEVTNNQMTNFCQRIANKNLLGNNSYLQSLIAWNLEKIADDYRDICKHILRIKIKQIPKKYLLILSEINQFFRDYYELYFDFSLSKLEQINMKKRKILKKLDKLFIEMEENMAMLLYFFKSIVVRCTDFSTAFVSINLSA